MPLPRAALRSLGLCTLALLAACDPPPAVAVRAAPPGGVVDSALPIAEEVRRFRATMDSVPAALRGGAPSREELVARFIRAVETLDTLVLPRLLVQADEFIGLYYPHTRYTAPPYELSPGLLWFQMVNHSSRGMSRLLQRDGGRPLRQEGTRCPAAPLVEERNRIWDGCLVRVRDMAGMVRERRLFGAILERDGTFKFLSFANDY